MYNMCMCVYDVDIIRIHEETKTDLFVCPESNFKWMLWN